MTQENEDAVMRDGYSERDMDIMNYVASANYRELIKLKYYIKTSTYDANNYDIKNKTILLKHAGTNYNLNGKLISNRIIAPSFMIVNGKLVLRNLYNKRYKTGAQKY